MPKLASNAGWNGCKNNCPDKSDLKQLRAEAEKLINYTDDKSL